MTTEKDRWTPSQAALNATDVADDTRIAYAGFWRRFGAMVIDWLLLWAATTVVSFVAGMAIGVGVAPGYGAAVITTVISMAAWLVVPWLYFALMECSTLQATLGKMAVGVKVTDLAGGPIGFGRATGRYWGKIISQMILYFGYIMAAFTARRLALHDMMAGTLVVYRNPSPSMVAAVAAAQPMPVWVIALIVLACMVPVAGILAAISIPAYKTYTLRAQVAEGMALAEELQARVAEELAGSDRPMDEILAAMQVTPGSSNLVSSLALQSGAIVITFGNQADVALRGETVALVPQRDREGRVSWVCGYRPLDLTLEYGEADPANLTTLPHRHLPAFCRL